MNLVTRVGPEWKRRSAAPKGADGCSGLGEPYHCTRNGNDVLIDPPLFCWPGRLPDGARLATSARISGRADIRYFAINGTDGLDNQVPFAVRARRDLRTGNSQSSLIFHVNLSLSFAK